MSVDIIIGKSGSLFHPLFPCRGDKCLKDPRCACRDTVRQERQIDAPEIAVATAQGLKQGGFNFYNVSNGFWFRYLDETGLGKEVPGFNLPDYPCTIPINPDMIMVFTSVARRFRTGALTTKHTESDSEFTDWFLFWMLIATSTYGELAAIELS